MKFVDEEQIEEIIQQLDQDVKNYEQVLESFRAEQPTIYAFLFSESFLLLTQNERELLLYLALVSWKSIKEVDERMPTISQNGLEEMEEKNYGLIEKSTAKQFREKLDPFFDNYPQEDLLAFVEDALSDDEEEEVSKAAREPIFVAVKTIIDCLCDIRV